MQMESTHAGEVMILTPLEKRLDAHVAVEFRAELLKHIDGGSRRIVVNLVGVEFIDSSGLGALVSALKRIGRDGELTVCSPTAGVRSMFELTRLHRVIPIVDMQCKTVKTRTRVLAPLMSKV
jgi:anti-sigma B factor antagonist